MPKPYPPGPNPREVSDPKSSGRQRISTLYPCFNGEVFEMEDFKAPTLMPASPVKTKSEANLSGPVSHRFPLSDRYFRRDHNPGAVS